MAPYTSDHAFFGTALALITLPSREVAATVWVTDKGITARTYWWRKLGIQWDDSMKVDRFLIRPLARQVLALRLVTKKGRRQGLRHDAGRRR